VAAGDAEGGFMPRKVAPWGVIEGKGHEAVGNGRGFGLEEENHSR
jgi:hypothetical protein